MSNHRIDSGFKEVCHRRDKYRCLECGSRHDLTVHHAYEMWMYQHKAVNDVWNMVTLCRSCHDRVHGIFAGFTGTGQKNNPELIRRYQRMCRPGFRQHPWRWMPICHHMINALRKNWCAYDKILEDVLNPPLPSKTYSTNKNSLPLPNGVLSRQKHCRCVGNTNYTIQSIK